MHHDLCCDARYGNQPLIRHKLPRMGAPQVHFPFRWTMDGESFRRAGEVCQIGMLFVAALSLWGFPLTTGLPYALALESAVLRVDFALLIVGLFTVFAARSFPAAPVVAWAAFEVTWILSNMHWRGGEAGVSYALATSRMLLIYGALALLNWYLITQSEKQS